MFRVGLDSSGANSTALLELGGQQGFLRDRRLHELLVELLGE